MEKNQIVEYLGCSTEQVRWGNNDDPRSFLIIGQHYTIEKVKVHSEHTKVKLYNKMGWFDSDHFKKVLNTFLDQPFTIRRTMDPSSITLTTPSKSFAYEQQARDIEKCSDLEELRNTCKCYVKLYYKQQETLKALGLPNEPNQ
jgi:hypothetical protein